MTEVWLLTFEDIKLYCQVENSQHLRLAQFYFREGATRIPVCDLRHPTLAPATFNLWSTGGQIADLETLQKVLSLAMTLMESWNANDRKTFKGIFPGEKYELSKL